MRFLEKLVYSKAYTENQSPIGPIHPSKARNEMRKIRQSKFSPSIN